MNEAFKKLVFHYLKEAVTTDDHSDENLEYMAGKFIEDAQRLKSARHDFKN